MHTLKNYPYYHAMSLFCYTRTYKNDWHAVLMLESAVLSFPHGQKPAGTFCWSFISCYVS